MSFTDFPPTRPLRYDEEYTWDLQIRVAGALADPTDSKVYVQIYDSSNTAKLPALTECTRSDTGKYYYVYTIPSTGPEGVWRAEFEYTPVGAAASAIHYEQFEVYEMGVLDSDAVPSLTITAVRETLLLPEETRISDTLIAMCIQRASTYIDARKHPSADANEVLYTKLLRACILTLAPYIRMLTNDTNTDYMVQYSALRTEYAEFFGLITRPQTTTITVGGVLRLGESITSRRVRRYATE